MSIISVLVYLSLSFTIVMRQCNAQAKPRHLEEISYDFHRHKLVVFGGAEMQSKEFTNPSGVFEQGSSGWQQVNGDGPVGRRGHALIYHHRDKLTYLFAGVTGIEKDSMLFDTWSWNGVAWKELETLSPVKNPEGAYDSRNNSILIYGDASNREREMYGEDQIFQLWRFMDGRWKLLSDSGPRPDGPYEMSFDSKRGALVVPTWTDEKLVVWEWVDYKWIHVTCTNDCPPARNRFGLAYSSSGGITYLFGGRDVLNRDNFFGDFWSWDGTLWKRIDSHISPQARAGLTMEDSSVGIILYDGITLNGGKTLMTNEFWRWSGGSWLK